MRNALRSSADRLRLQAIVVTAAALLAASALPAVTYYFVWQHDNAELGPFAWTHWAVVGACCALGIAAHALGSKALMAAHAALGCMLGAALGGFDTALWFTLDTRCATSQVAFAGCLNCPCAATNTCTVAMLAEEPLCTSCSAYPREVCSPVQQEQHKFVLAFTGLSAVLFLALPTFYSLLTLARLEAADAAEASHRHVVVFSVDQQTALVEAGEKPSVTPAMLGVWVGLLLDCGDQECTASAEKCRAALAARGFDLPVKQKRRQPEKKWGGSRCGCFGRRRAGGAKKDSKGGSAQEVAVTASSAAGGDAYAAAEAGEGRRGARKGSQVAVEEAQRVQFKAG